MGYMQQDKKCESGSSLSSQILTSEGKISKAEMKTREAYRPDKVPAEFLQNLGQLTLEWLVEFYNASSQSDLIILARSFGTSLK